MDQDFRRTTQRRDYTREVINTRLPAPPPTPEPPKKKSKKWLRLILTNLARFIVFAVIVGAGYLAWRHFSKPSPARVDSELVTDLRGLSVGFPIFYPTTMPSTFTLEPSTVSDQNNIVSYSYIYGSSNQLNVVEQTNPPVIEQVTKTRQFNVGNYSAYIADLNGHTTGFLKTDKTLVILSSSQNINADTLQNIISSFKPVN